VKCFSFFISSSFSVGTFVSSSSASGICSTPSPLFSSAFSVYISNISFPMTGWFSTILLLFACSISLLYLLTYITPTVTNNIAIIDIREYVTTLLFVLFLLSLFLILMRLRPRLELFHIKIYLPSTLLLCNL